MIGLAIVALKLMVIGMTWKPRRPSRKELDLAKEYFKTGAKDEKAGDKEVDGIQKSENGSPVRAVRDDDIFGG